MPCTCKNGIFDKEQNNYINYEKTCDKCKKNGTETNGNSFENNTNVQLTRYVFLILFIFFLNH